MSWQSYVDDQLVGTGNVTGAAIIGHDGNVWASKGLELKAGEGAKLVAGFKDSASVLSGGILIGATKYLGIRADDKSIYGMFFIIIIIFIFLFSFSIFSFIFFLFLSFKIVS